MDILYKLAHDQAMGLVDQIEDELKNVAKKINTASNLSQTPDVQESLGVAIEHFMSEIGFD